MKITLTNEIQIDQEMEVIHQEFDVQYQLKNDWHYLIFTNEELEKVILKFDQEELTMTRFSNPKSIMRFIKAAEAVVVLPTPLGLQHFVTVTKAYRFDETNNKLTLHYDLRPFDSEQVFASYQMVISWA